MQTQEIATNKAIKLRKEFDLKSHYLRDFCIENGGEYNISPLDYYCDLYNNDEEYLSGKKEEKGKNGDMKEIPFCYKLGDSIRKAPNGIDEVLQIAIFRKSTEIALFPASYYNWPLQKNLKDFYAIVIDLDGVSAADLYCLLKLEMKRLLPTYIVNSGSGVHLVYVFEKPIVAYKYRHKYIKMMIADIGDFFKKARYGYKIDPNSKSLVHPYRVIGSQTKLGQNCVVFRTGKRWSVDKMLKKLNIKTDVFKEKTARKTTATKKATPQKYDNVVETPKGNKNFYNFFSLQMTNVEEGHRYLALFALAVVAYKCRVSREEVEDLMGALIDVYNRRGDEKVVRDYEIKKAMKGYSSKYVKVSSKQLEEWSGIEFPRRSVKRRPVGQRLKRKEHLEVARAVKNTKETETRKALMRRYLEAKPTASLNDLVDGLGWSRATIVKYRKMVLNG